MRSYTCYIDESGQAGIENIRENGKGGASPFLTLAGVVVKDKDYEAHLDVLSKLATDFNKKSLHATNLKHEQKVHFARALNGMPVRIVGLVSKKETLGNYAEKIEKSSQMYYNKCVHYLLERLGHFCLVRKIQRSEMKVVFERTSLDYGKLFHYISQIQKTPYHGDADYLRSLDVGNFSVKSKKDEALLALPDFVAHALFKCVDVGSSNLSVVEPRYIQEVQGRFFGCKETQRVEGFGLKMIHDLASLGLQSEVFEVLDAMLSDKIVE